MSTNSRYGFALASMSQSCAGRPMAAQQAGKRRCSHPVSETQIAQRPHQTWSIVAASWRHDFLEPYWNRSDLPGTVASGLNPAWRPRRNTCSRFAASEMGNHGQRRVRASSTGTCGVGSRSRCHSPSRQPVGVSTGVPPSGSMMILTRPLAVSNHRCQRRSTLASPDREKTSSRSPGVATPNRCASA
jgi:hypothetical protein